MNTFDALSDSDTGNRKGVIIANAGAAITHPKNFLLTRILLLSILAKKLIEG